MDDAHSRHIRRGLMRAIAAEIEERGLKQREAARLFGTTQPRISDIVRGKVDEFTIDALVNMLSAAGLSPHLSVRAPQMVRGSDIDPVVRAYVAGVDRSLVREALRRSPTERVAALADLQALAEEAAAAGRRDAGAGGQAAGARHAARRTWR
jgi:predicted XRE-type DNA-binding protein